jgi:dTMP kinase
MFISFEGPDGCGKTTQLALLADFLVRQGYTVCRTREPGGTPIGEQIRVVLHDPANREMDPRTEILLYSASRAQIVAQVIRPALAAGKVVLCDRFYDSTLAYQGYGHGLDLNVLRQITLFATGGLKPDLTIYLEVAPEVGLRRRQQDQEAEWNRLDALALEFHRRVHAGYHELIAAEPARWVVVNGERPVDAVQADIRAVVTARLSKSTLLGSEA